jgi:Ca2+-binding EF-hand superfamily protein
LAFNP